MKRQPEPTDPKDPLVLLLGSASARRAKILRDLGIPFITLVPETAETHWDDDPAGTARANALIKHAWCREREPDRPLVTADTVISMDGRCIGKPGSQTDAFAMLRAFSGRRHEVLTAVALSALTLPVAVEVVRSTVAFRPLSDETIRTYVERVPPLDKAGAYDIDQHSDLIVESYEGSFTNIMGLPGERVSSWWRRLTGEPP